MLRPPPFDTAHKPGHSGLTVYEIPGELTSLVYGGSIASTSSVCYTCVGGGE